MCITLPPPPPPVGNPPPPPVGTTPTGDVPPPPPSGDLPPPPPPPPGTGSAGLQMADKFTSISGLVGSGLGGAVGAVKGMGNLNLIGSGMKGVEIPSGADGADTESIKMGGSIGDKIKGAGMAAKGLGKGTLQGAKYGAMIGGIVSAASNGYQVLTGKKTGADAVGTFAADTATATLSGAGGALAGGMTALLAGSALGGLPLTILVGTVGLVGAVGTHMLTQKTGFYDSIKNAVKGMFGGQQ
ncbi:MAG: hypothetical protein U0354_06840 [Candidatus Sericytochromatia bacterium]